MKRNFIFTDEKSNKFWTIEVADNSYTVNYGKVGTGGQTQTKDFTDEASCLKAVNKLIAEKTKKGYIEVEENPIKDLAHDKPEKDYQTFMKAFESEEDKKSNNEKYAVNIFNVDIEDKDHIIATINTVSQRLKEGSTLFSFGKVVDGIIVEYYNYDEFYLKAVEYAEVRLVLQKLCEQIINTNYNNRGCPRWEDLETLFGVNQAFALAMVDKKYIKTATEMLTSMNNGDHSVPHERIAEMMSKWGVCEETLAFFAELWNMPLQDLDADVESIVENIKIEDMLEDEKLFNFFLKKLGISLYKDRNRSEFQKEDYLDDEENEERIVEFIECDLETLLQAIFPEHDILEIGKKFLELVLEQKTPTYKLLTNTAL